MGLPPLFSLSGKRYDKFDEGRMAAEVEDAFFACDAKHRSPYGFERSRSVEPDISAGPVLWAKGRGFEIRQGVAARKGRVVLRAGGEPGRSREKAVSLRAGRGAARGPRVNSMAGEVHHESRYHLYWNGAHSDPDVL